LPERKLEQGLALSRGRGAFGREEGEAVRCPRARRSANAGMSSEKARAKRVRRKPKVSDGR
jgi:hypothetical protein